MNVRNKKGMSIKRLNLKRYREIMEKPKKQYRKKPLTEAEKARNKRNRNQLDDGEPTPTIRQCIEMNKELRKMCNTVFERNWRWRFEECETLEEFEKVKEMFCRNIENGKPGIFAQHIVHEGQKVYRKQIANRRKKNLQ